MNNEDLKAKLHLERDKNEFLTNMAMALDALDCVECDCDSEQPCLKCICELTLLEERVNADAAEAEEIFTQDELENPKC